MRWWLRCIFAATSDSYWALWMHKPHRAATIGHNPLRWCIIWSRIWCNAIRVQVFELADSEIAVEKCISLANALEASAYVFRWFNYISDTPPFACSSPVGNIAAVKKRTAQPFKASNRICEFCVLEERLRTVCPARRNACLKCVKQGHWAAACKSAFATFAWDDDEPVASVLCSLKTTKWQGLLLESSKVFLRRRLLSSC